MRDKVFERCKKVGVFVIKNKSTVRNAANYFDVSKSTIYKDIVDRLPRVNKALADGAIEVLQKNKAERHIRGGLATKAKYKNLK